MNLNGIRSSHTKKMFIFEFRIYRIGIKEVLNKDEDIAQAIFQILNSLNCIYQTYKYLMV